MELKKKLLEKLLIIGLALAAHLQLVAQNTNDHYINFNISGPVSVCPDGTTSYTYSGPISSLTWSVTGGQFVGSSYGSSVSVRWTSSNGTLAATGSESFSDCWYEPDIYPPVMYCNTDNYYYTSNPFTITSSIVTFQVSGVGYVCSVAPVGVNVLLDGSLANYTYQLKRDGISVDTPIAGGNGSITWSNLTIPGAYRVQSIGACPALMDGTAYIYEVSNSAGGTVSGSMSSCGGTSGHTFNLSGYNGAILRWEKNNGSGWTTIPNTSNLEELNYVEVINTTTSFRAIVRNFFNGPCQEAYATPATIDISTPTVGGTISGSNTICESGSGTLWLSGHVGSVVRWEQNAGGGWAHISNTTISLNYSNVTQTTQYRAWVVNGACTTGAYSSIATVTIDASTVSGVLSPTANGSSNVNLALSGQTGLVLRWEQNTGSGWTFINNTNTSHPAPLSDLNGNTWFRAVVKSGVCTQSVTPAVQIGVKHLTYTVSVQLTADAAPAWQWYKNGSLIAGATQQNYTATEIGTYTVKEPAGNLTTGLFLVFPLLSNISQKVNAISSITILKKGVTESTSLYTLLPHEISQTISYMDAMSKPFQTVAVGASPAGFDVISAAGTGKQGLTDTTFLPYVSTIKSGTYRPTALRGINGQYTSSEQYQFYQGTAKVVVDNYPFARTMYRNTPDAKVIEQGSPGAHWQPGQHSVKHTSTWNNTTTLTVRYWKADGTTNSNYPANSVAISIVTDENNNLVRSFVNALGQTVLKQVQIDEALEGVYTTWLETYYIYDEYGRLKYIVPPKAMKLLGTGATLDAKNITVSELIYQYTYDNRSRVTTKKVPGANAESIVYDKFDRPVFTQDANQASLNRWLFVKYDRFNRPVYSGWYARTVTRAVLQAEMDALDYTTQPYFEIEQVNATYLGYSNTVYPTASLTVLAANYYDHYDFDRNGAADYTYDPNHLAGQEATAATKLRGMGTGSKKAMINDAGNVITSSWLISVVFYDSYDRPIQTIGNNHLYLTVADKSTVLYDFVRPIKTKTTHYQNATTSVALTDWSDYDHAGRTLRTYRQVNANTPVTVAEYEYNALGQLVDKKLHVVNGTPLQSVDFRYTIRGWLKSINNAQLISDNGSTNDESNDYFGLEMVHNTSENGLSNSLYYNGNVSAIKWKGPGQTAGASDQRSYVYTYDKSDRLKSAAFTAHNGTAWTKETNTLNETITYDHNGNIKTLVRTQNQRGLSGITVTSTPQAIDNLTYTYASSRNRLTKVEDAATAAGGFLNGVNTTTEYTYNNTGSLNADNNKGIASTAYNTLSKPRLITYSGSPAKTIKYTYDAAGSKLKMVVYDATTTTTTDYVGGFVYVNSTLSFFSSPEGRIIKNGSNYEYQYALADQQGNTRVIFSANTPAPDPKTSNMEAATNTDFGNYINRVDWTSMNSTPGGTYSQLVNGGYNSQVGVTKSYKVYAGDKVKVQAKAKYIANSGGSNLAGFATALLSAFNLAPPASGEVGTAAAGINTWGGIVAGGGGQGSSGAPKAFVNILLFDKKYNFIDIAWDQVDAGATLTHDDLMKEVTITEEGFAYVYISNENASLSDVYFDDVVMTFTKSNIVQYNEYYSFGMQTANSWTRENTTGNNFLANSGTELNTLSNLYDLEYRHYDPVLGRMNGVDPMATKYASLTPYNYSFNDPVSFTDPNGADPSGYSDGFDPIFEPYTSMMYTSRGWVQDDVIYHRITGWSAPVARYAGPGLDWMFGKAGTGPSGSGGWQSSTFAGMGGISLGAFLNSAWNSTNGGSWSNGQGSLFSNQEQALASGMAYNDYHNSWANTVFGSAEASLATFNFFSQSTNFTTTLACSNCDAVDVLGLQTQGRPLFGDLWNNYPSDRNENVWNTIGGKVKLNHDNNPSAFSNSCAVRLSRGLNLSSNYISFDKGKTMSGADNRWYYYRVKDMDSYLTSLYGNADISSNNRNDFSGKVGIIEFQVKGWSDASGHFTLWDGSKVALDEFWDKSYNVKLWILPTLPPY